MREHADPAELAMLRGGPGTINNLLDGFEAAINATSTAVTAAPRRAGRMPRASGLAAAPA